MHTIKLATLTHLYQNRFFLLCHADERLFCIYAEDFGVRADFL